MRIVLPTLVLAGALAPAPALAAEGETQRMVEELADPVRQEAMAATVGAMAEAVLAMPAAPLLRAAETMAGRDPDYVDPDVSVGDLMGPDAADAPREFADRLPERMGQMAMLATTLEAMLPELRAMGDRMAQDMADAAQRYPR